MKVSHITTNAFWKGESGVKAVVEDQGREYKASLHIKGSQAIDYSCSCAQGNSYRGMCPHCQALFQAYKEQESENQGRIVTTSQQARAMIREYTNREVARIMSEGEGEQVKLFVAMMAGRREIKLEFKLGKDRLYVLKDLSAFVRAVANGTYVEYGKNLSFHHSVQAFQKESQPLLEFVMEVVNTYLEHHEQFQKASFTTSPVMRFLTLSRTSMDRFFGLMKGNLLEIEDHKGHSRQVAVTDKSPELTVTVRRRGREGVLVSIPKDLMVLEGERYLYFADTKYLYCCDQECSEALLIFFKQMTEGFGSAYEIEVNNKDMPLFYERVLKRIAAYCTIDSGNINLETFKPEELKARFDFDSDGPNSLILKPTLSYGDYSFQPVEDERLPRTVCRDVPGEFRISQLITKYFKYKEYDSSFPAIRNDEEAVYSLLTVGIPEFMAFGEVYFSEPFKKLKILPPPKISVGIKSIGNWLELNVDTEGLSGSELNKLLAEYSRKKKYYRLKSGEFINLDDNGLLSVARLVQDMSVSVSELESRTFRLPAYRALYLDGILKEGSGITLYRDQLYKAVVRGMKSVEDSDFEIPGCLDHILRGYQKTGYRWLKTLDHYGFGGILADDMGLGKTIQVIALLLDEKEKEGSARSLIVCPASLVYNWENEIHTFGPGLKVLTVTGTAAEREELLAHSHEYDVLITSYDLLKRDAVLYEGKSFRFQIIDEAQYIKNASTQSAKAVKGIEARGRFALTGTPIENRLSELWSIFDYLMPGFLFSYQRFKKEYELPIVRDQDGQALKNLHRLIGPFILRRLKKDVLKELPDKLETVVYSAFDKKQKEIYTANAYQLKKELENMEGRQGRDNIQILAQLTRLRQICCDPHLCYGDYSGESAKLETCIDLVRNGVEGGHKILLFSQFTSMLEVISQRLKNEGIPYYILTGATPKEERIRMVSSFKDDEVPLFLISLKAGGTGLNLTAADMVIHFDPWWNVAAQNQATDRAHRMGQEKQVSVFKLITKGTIEENILKLQESKKDLAEQIITEGTISLSNLSRDDLLGLLKE
ncbi:MULTISPECIES: DEAD/DEAH box helicase [Clostridia]|jgi:superfamily II DNA or RNA helicase|uniref:SNF2 helicase associated domain-containing protein n=1 Tax=Lacrimispora xylanolytica TaxID=29375 RepID=A0ABY7AJN2_9FIRM|nr:MULTISPECIES: SNF2 helicase associated domain-containing protein [Clostridia]WAJ25678.1 SNF2 helicase associated domain-containing protein [Lacrimispora xylanolytica]